MYSLPVEWSTDAAMMVIVAEAAGWPPKHALAIFHRIRLAFGLSKRQQFHLLCCWCGLGAKGRDVCRGDGTASRSFMTWRMSLARSWARSPLVIWNMNVLSSHIYPGRKTVPGGPAQHRGERGLGHQPEPWNCQVTGK